MTKLQQSGKGGKRLRKEGQRSRGSTYPWNGGTRTSTQKMGENPLACREKVSPYLTNGSLLKKTKQITRFNVLRIKMSTYDPWEGGESFSEGL